MRVFLSYSSSDRTLIEPIYLALCAQGHTVFFDRAGLSAGEEYNVRIRRAIENSHLMLFMVSPESLDAGSYTLSELAIAQKTWQHPAGRVLPVILRSIPLERIPPYLKSVTLLEPEGDLTASVADQVYRIAETRRRTGARVKRDRWNSHARSNSLELVLLSDRSSELNVQLAQREPNGQ